MALTIGDVVQLKSGGPAMTISSNPVDQKVETTWFDEKSKIFSAWFPVNGLKPFERDLIAEAVED